jgi:hypothetical protein
MLIKFFLLDKSTDRIDNDVIFSSLFLTAPAAILMQCFYSLKNNSNTIRFPDGVMPLKMLLNVCKKFGVAYVFIISIL